MFISQLDELIPSIPQVNYDKILFSDSLYDETLFSDCLPDMLAFESLEYDCKSILDDYQLPIRHYCCEICGHVMKDDKICNVADCMSNEKQQIYSLPSEKCQSPDCASGIKFVNKSIKKRLSQREKNNLKIDPVCEIKGCRFQCVLEMKVCVFHLPEKSYSDDEELYSVLV